MRKTLEFVLKSSIHRLHAILSASIKLLFISKKRMFLYLITTCLLLLLIVSQSTNIRTAIPEPPGRYLEGGGQDKQLACQFPLLDPFDPSILHYVSHPRQFYCAKTQPYLSYLDNLGQLWINETEWNALDDSENMICKWRQLDFMPGKNHSLISKTRFQKLLVGTPQHFTTDTVEVECSTVRFWTGGRNIIYSMVHGHPRTLETPMVDNGDEQLSVLLFTLDSVSLNMFRRQLPDTYNYLTVSMGAFVFRGYNKVGDNTFPNMMAVLTGKRVTHQQEGMSDEFPGVHYGNVKFDDFLLIWKIFSQQKGYKTAFLEDTPDTGLFYYKKKGFNKKPVDWFFRPYMLSRVDKVGTSSKYCYANSPNYAHQIDIGARLLRKCLDKRCFIVNTLIEVSHDDCCDIERSDRIFAESFKSLHRAGFLNKTIILVMADHGHRYSSLRNTQIGLLEERLPMLGIVFPEWFLQLHPNIKENLLLNQWRLSTPFDVHETFLDILKVNYDGVQRPLTKRGLSLLYPLPLNRTCNSAGIPDHFCTCMQGVAIDVNNPIVESISDFVIKHINNKLAPLATSCAFLTLKQTMHAVMFTPNQKVVHSVRNFKDNKEFELKKPSPKTSEVNQYRVLVEAEPSGALLEALVNFNLDTQAMKISNDVSRINPYGKQSACISDTDLERYCFCK